MNEQTGQKVGSKVGNQEPKVGVTVIKQARIVDMSVVEQSLFGGFMEQFGVRLDSGFEAVDTDKTV